MKIFTLEDACLDLRIVSARVWYCNGLFPKADDKHMFDTRGRQVETTVQSVQTPRGKAVVFNLPPQAIDSARKKCSREY